MFVRHIQEPTNKPSSFQNDRPSKQIPVCAFALHPLPEPPVQGLWGGWGGQPKELLSWRHSRTALRSPKSACLSPVSATTLPPSLKWDTETRVRFLLNHHRCTPKGPQEADTSSAVPQEMGQHPQAPTSSELHNGGNESLEVTPSNSGHSHFRAPLALCAYSGLWRPSQSLLSLSGSLSATWGTRA